MECHRFQGQDGFTRFVHRFDLFLEPARGAHRAKLVVSSYHDWYCRKSRRDPANTANKRFGDRWMSDSDGVGLASVTGVTDIDVFIAGSGIHTCIKAHSDIVGASGIPMECVSANGRVVVAGAVEPERPKAGGRVATAARVISKRIRSVGCVAGATAVRRKRLKTVRRVVVADRIMTERAKPGSRVVVAGGIVIERADAGGCVITSGGIEKKRIRPGRRVEGAARVG